MTLLYKKEGAKESGHFETDAAIKAGNAVRAELRKSASGGTTSATPDAAALTTTSSHVRSNSPAIVSIIAQATERSTTFRRLVEDIDASDSYVYVNEGHCGHGVRACFVSVTSSGARRFMWVKVDTHKTTDAVLMGDIGHELQHTLEAIADPSVRSDATRFFLYERIGRHNDRATDAYETQVAIDTGMAVRSEVLKFNREAKSK